MLQVIGPDWKIGAATRRLAGRVHVSRMGTITIRLERFPSKGCYLQVKTVTRKILLLTVGLLLTKPPPVQCSYLTRKGKVPPVKTWL